MHPDAAGLAKKLLDYDQLDIESKAKDLRDSLKVLNQNVADRKTYLIEQENLISKTITEWNEQLSAIKSEAGLTEAGRTRLLIEVVQQEQRRDELVIEIGGLENKLLSLTQAYETRAKDYRTRLQTLDTEAQTKTQYIGELQTKLEARIKAVVLREQTVAINEATQSQEREELDQRERKLRLDYRLAHKEYS
jgi:hypothetical protein